MRSNKRLGGKPPRQPGRLLGNKKANQTSGETLSLLIVLGVGFLVLGGVAGFGWSMDQQIRAGLLRQHQEAVRRPDWVDLDALPAHVPDAFVAVVDPAFLEHGAVRSGRKGVTLSRALVRQVHLLPNSVGGEARERVMGPLLEQRMPKRDLLEIFLNRAFLGTEQGYPVYGVYHAAREYFGKDPQQLTLGESATLAGLLLEPRIADPENRVGAVGVRRNEVLKVMRLAGLIAEDQFQAALAEPLGFQPGLEDHPMTRPADWIQGVSTIRLPEDLRPKPDSVPTNPTESDQAPR